MEKRGQEEDLSNFVDLKVILQSFQLGKWLKLWNYPFSQERGETWKSFDLLIININKAWQSDNYYTMVL